MIDYDYQKALALAGETSLCHQPDSVITPSIPTWLYLACFEVGDWTGETDSNAKIWYDGVAPVLAVGTTDRLDRPSELAALVCLPAYSGPVWVQPRASLPPLNKIRVQSEGWAHTLAAFVDAGKKPQRGPNGYLWRRKDFEPINFSYSGEVDACFTL